MIIDRNVLELNKDILNKFISKIQHIEIEPSEESKNYQSLTPLIMSLIENGFRRKNRMIAIGGGVIQDIVGFISSILFRGVDWIFIPTTLLAQCDSCIGSKTSINFGKYKNQLGTFYPPRKIVIDISFIDTLADLEIRSGLGEMIHYFLVSGIDDFHMIRDNYHLCLKDKKILKSLILRSLKIKSNFIELDEFDKGVRNILNYGHSFGHALETITNYNIPHGIAVSIGMDMANYISMKLGYLDEIIWREMRQLLSMNFAGVKLTELNADAFIDALKKDKKNIDNDLQAILTRGIGSMFKTTIILDLKTHKLIEAYFKGLGQEK